MTATATISDADLVLLREHRRRMQSRRQEGFVEPEFRGAALEAQTITAHEWMIAGPAETGKTFGALWRLDTLLRTTPKSQYTLLRKVRADMDGTVLNTWRRVIAMRPNPAVPYGGEKPQWYIYPNGARLWVGGLDKPGKALSAERDGIYVNQAEELDQLDWEVLTTRTTGRGAVTETPMLFGDCNPGPADHWIMRRPSIVLLKSVHQDNPSLYARMPAGSFVLTPQGERSIGALSRLTGLQRQRLYLGLWVGAEGQFFEQWDEDVHVIDPFPIPADWPIWGAFDHGFVHNTAFGVLTRHEGTIYLVGEHVRNKWLVPQQTDGMDGLLGRLGIDKRRLSVIAAGHDVFQQRADSQGKTIAAQYEERGYTLSHADIGRINGAMELLARVGNPQAEPPLPATLKIFRTCPRTIAAMARMIHDPRNPEDVLKVDAEADGTGGDDEYDMLRYGVMEGKRLQPKRVARSWQG